MLHVIQCTVLIKLNC